MATSTLTFLDIETRYALLEALRSSALTGHAIGRKALALDLLGHRDLAHRVEHVHGLLIEAHQRYDAAFAAAPIGSDGMLPDRTPEMQAAIEHLNDCRDRWHKLEEEVSITADGLEAGMDEEDPAYIARRQEGNLP